MSNDLRKFEVESNIRLLLIRYRGNMKQVIDEYDKQYGIRLTAPYVERVYKKLKREVNSDKYKWVSFHFAEELISQCAEIQALLKEQYRSYEGLGVKPVSLCCGAPIEPYPCKDDSFLCKSCDKECVVTLYVDGKVEKLKLSIIDKMQEQNKFTVEFLKSMGFLQEPGKNETVVHNYLPGSRETTLPATIDAESKDQVDSMTSFERLKLLDDYRKGIPNDE